MTMPTPYYVTAPGRASQPAPMLASEAWDILKRLGWTETELSQLAPEDLIAAAEGRQRPPGAANQGPETISVSAKGSLQWNPNTGQWEIIPGSVGGTAAGGGGGAANPYSPWRTDNMPEGYAWNEQTGDVMQLMPEGKLMPPLWSPIETSDGAIWWYVPDETVPEGYRKEVLSEPGKPQIVSTQETAAGVMIIREDGSSDFIRYPPGVQNTKQQELALQASMAGYPNVSTNVGGVQYQQVPPSEQILAGQEPRAEFRQRSAGAAGTAFQPVTGYTPEGPSPNAKVNTPITRNRALTIAEAFARGPGVNPLARVGASLGSLGWNTGNPYRNAPGQQGVGMFGQLSAVRGGYRGSAEAERQDYLARQQANLAAQPVARLGPSTATIGGLRTPGATIAEARATPPPLSTEELRTGLQTAYKRKKKATLAGATA